MNKEVRTLSTQMPQTEKGIASRLLSAATSERMLNELHALNLRYLELLARNRFRNASAPIAKELAAASIDARQRAAQCPFSLFDIAFDDVRIWDAMFDRIAERRGSDENESAPVECTDFAKAVLILVWHLLNGSEAGEVQARLLLALEPRIATRLADFSLPEILELGAEAVDLVRPRWAGHSRFWTELVRSAAEGQLHELHAVRLLGRQLLAADALRIASTTVSSQIKNYEPRYR